MAELGKAKLMSTAPVAKYRQAIENMDHLNIILVEAMLNNMKIGRGTKEGLMKTEIKKSYHRKDDSFFYIISCI